MDQLLRTRSNGVTQLPSSVELLQNLEEALEALEILKNLDLLKAQI